MLSRLCSTSSSALACRDTPSGSSAALRLVRNGKKLMATTMSAQHIPSAAIDPKAQPAIEMIDVHKWYGEFHVLRDINLNVKRGERIVICGPSDRKSVV